MVFPQSDFSSTVPWSNWNLEVLVFAEGGKPESSKRRSKDDNQQQTLKLVLSKLK